MLVQTPTVGDIFQPLGQLLSEALIQLLIKHGLRDTKSPADRLITLGSFQANTNYISQSDVQNH